MWQTDDLQYNGVVKADVGKCPVHYHHVCVEDLSSQLQQAEHGTPMKLYKRQGGRAEQRERGKSVKHCIHVTS